MAFRIRPSEPFDAEFRRVAESQLRQAIAVLRDQPDGEHPAIHAARKRFKRLRALYRLVASDAKAFSRRENDRMRDIGRSLSSVRDATALIETVDYLAGLAVSPEEIAALGFASQALIDRRDRIAAAETDRAQTIDQAIAACEEAIAALDMLDLPRGEGRTARRLKRAFTKHGRKTKAALAACRLAPDAEAFHDLRKCGQTGWMYLTLFADLYPSALGALKRETKQLVDLLGHEHDLSVLTQTINESPELFGDGDTLALLLGAIITRQQAIREEALARAGTVVADHPKREGRIIGRLWLEAAEALS
ncbi:CHAD domain-containing protein [Rhizobium sp. SGZ-381]|uniref:CHAD domain-containing protein n=1 Tax=Rhizobium sp. SGZ-381 TaxID=3342800 RepID=UPI003670F147